MLQIFHAKHLSQDVINIVNILENFSKIIQLFPREYPGLLILNYSSNCSSQKFQYACALQYFCVCIWYIPHTFLIHPNHNWSNYNLSEIFHSSTLPGNYFLEFTGLNCWKFCIYKLPHPLPPQLSICTFSPADRLRSNCRTEGKA